MSQPTQQPENIYRSVLRQAQERRDAQPQRLDEQISRILRKAGRHGGK